MRCAVREGLDAISTHLAVLQPDQADALRGMLSIALQSDVEVTDTASKQGQLVSQAFCSALPIAYTNGSVAPLDSVRVARPRSVI